MKSKRMLTLVVVFSMLFSLLSPASAMAVETGRDTVKSQKTQEAVDNETGRLDRLVVSGKDTNGIRTLRDDKESNVSGEKLEIVGHADGEWEITETEAPTSLANASLPTHIKELRALAETYSARERVSAFIVLKDAPLINYYGNINEVPEDQETLMEMWQEAVIMLIEEDVLEGEKLDVVGQFSYLTNAIVVETEFGNLEKIAQMDEIDKVFVTPVFYPCTTESDPLTVSSGQMSGVDVVWNSENLGYTGSGMTIAILDTGLDLDHPSFAAAPEGAAWSKEDVAGLLAELDLNAEQLYNGTLTADDLYSSAKVPFVFNYWSGTTNVSHTDGVGDHGTHVAGISAANAVEGTGVVGMAPDAQIIVMKVFSSENGGANMYDILNALEDCLKMGVDVANLSLGSPAGFSQTGIEVIDEIYAKISTTDLIVDIAAGNEGTSAYSSLWGNAMNTTDHPDTSTMSSPATYENAMVVGSVDNNYVQTSYFTLADSSKVFYQQSVEYLYAYIDYSLESLKDAGELEYVIVPNLGAYEDFYDAEGNSIVEGKVAVVKRGELSFAEKTANAEMAGAVAVLIWDNVTENIFNFGMTTAYGEDMYPSIPVVLITLEDGQKMADAEIKTMTADESTALRIDANGGQMSSFSSWGVAPDLRLLPDISGVGGNVYSCYDGGNYGLMSGTSMATPQVAGVTALVLQYLEEKYPELTVAEKRTLVDSLMMSTAVPVVDATTGVEASPRQQGAGLVNALNAVTSEAYLSVAGSERPKADLYDNVNGTYSFTFTVHNMSGEEKTYTLDSSLLCEDYATDENHPGVYFMAEQDRALDKGAVSFSASTITVPANGAVDVTVTIHLTDADKQWIDTYFANGNYVEGYVYLNSEEGVDLSLPFLGFYGDWTDAPVFDSGYWYQNGMWMDVTEVEANQYYHIMWTDLGGQSWVLGFNPYTGALKNEDGNIIYDPANNVLSPNGDGVLDEITDVYLSLMRNAKWVHLTWTDAEGNILYQESVDYISKTMFISGYGDTVPFVYSWYYDDLYDYTDADDNYLAHGTELTLTISAQLDYGMDDEVHDSMVEIPITIDTVAPALVDEAVQSSDENGNYVTLTIAEENPAYVVLMNKSGTQVYNSYSEMDMTDNGDGTYTITVDVTDLGDNFVVALCDYGCNESFYDLVYTLTDNAPDMDKTALYAYQVYNEYIYYNYGYDSMFGWTTIDKGTADVTMISSDAYEYYALTAAEHVDGYVFAVDAGYNFMCMVPGLWNRNWIRNLGVNVLDMAYDDTTGTMYLNTKTEGTYGTEYCLYTVDLLTGELELLRQYDSQYDMPWAMTFVDGDLYCCKYYYNGFYQVDLENETYELTAVTDSEGNKFVPKTSAERDTRAYYSQSMTYSKEDQRIYWAYYSGSAGELITIDPATWTSTAVAMAWDQEYVGVLTLEDTTSKLPESNELTELVISDEQLIMGSGEQYGLTVSMLPWNAPKGTLTWSSSDETIATVDENGVVTAVAEGIAVVTATCGELSVSCNVTVVNITGEVYVYSYYATDGSMGDWLNIDLSTMTAESVYTAPMGVDFIAADYNGHDGKIYGFDANGQAYCYDPATEEAVALGSPDSSMIPADMAYDYSTGMMYAIVYDYMSWSTTLYAMNMTTGKLVPLSTAYDVFMTLACDLNGTLYGINFYGELYELAIVEGSAGGGIGGWEPLSTVDSSSTYIEQMYLMQTPVMELSYAQSMCYDHSNDVILWTNPETASMYWLDGKAEIPYAVNLGNPTDGIIEYVCMFTEPAEIPELPYFAVESISVEDMVLLEGGSKTPDISIEPLNATNQNVTYTSADESVVTCENGVVTGVAVGTTTVTAVLVDGDATYECTFQVTVKKATDNIYGFLMTDIATYAGTYWINIADTDPVNYAPIEYVYYDGVYYSLYAAEHVNGKVYAYGFDPNDYSAHFQFITIDAEDWSVEAIEDMGEAFPFVYDMAFDYTTGTMYALAGPSDNATDLYYINMSNGKLIECMYTDPMLMSLAIDAEGTIYAIAASEEEYDPMTWSSTYSTAKMYTIDVENGTCEEFMDTGVYNNMLSSMAYDYDTGYLYWTGLFQGANYVSGLHLIDLEDKTCHNLGTIGAAGSQVTGLMIFADEYPEIQEELQKITLVAPLVELAVEDTELLEIFMQPANAEVELVWTSGDESIATVDGNGVVTGVGAGTTTVTVSAVVDGQTIFSTCTVVVYGEEDYFITYNWTDGGFSAIGRPDPTVVANLTEGEDVSAVTAMAMVNGYIFAYDEENNLFITSEADGFERTYIGNAGIAVDEPFDEVSAGYYTYYYTYTPNFVVRDMAWDAANERMLAIGCAGVVREYYMTNADGSYVSETYTEYLEEDGGCRLYEVDLETGTMTELCVVGGEYASETGVYMLTVDGNGQVYTYISFMDYVCKLDTETGDVEYMTTFQNQGIYGSSDGDLMAMEYDAASGMLYLLFTENGNNYLLYKFNPSSGVLSKLGFVGEVVYSNWVNRGDAFAGLVLNMEHVCEYELTGSVESTCHVNGSETYICSWCGDTYTDDLPLDPENHQHWDNGVVTTPATCSEDGVKTFTCACGETNTEAIPALGHSYDTEVVPPTNSESGYTNYRCRNCGISFVGSHTEPTGSANSGANANTGDSANIALWMSLAVMSVMGAAIVLVVNKKKYQA